MTALWSIIRVVMSASPKAMLRGAALAIVVLAMGVALLGLSGWFIVATGAAGLAGIGIAFDVFRPSAGVRFLALGRTGARYGERILTHDATLRALAVLRVRLLRGLSWRDGRALTALRGEEALNRIVGDVDAIDGILLRLVIPVVATVVTLLGVSVLLTWLADPVFVAILWGALVGPAAAVVFAAARRTIGHSARQEAGAQVLRASLITTLRDRDSLIVAGRMSRAQAELGQQDAHLRSEARALDRVDRATGVALTGVLALAGALALGVGGWLVQQSALPAAPAVIAFFVTLALAEGILPLRRAAAEFGRLRDASARINAMLTTDPTGTAPVPTRAPDAPVLQVPALNLTMGPGDGVALIGKSGAGKTTMLLQIAGVLDGGPGALLDGCPIGDWPEGPLREHVTMVPQRSALMAGSVRDNLTLVGAATDDTLWEVLEAVDLAEMLRGRDGLDTPLGEGGRGLSGGQMRRMALARAMLRRPRLLLLDEPTEGLDRETADRMLHALRSYLPDAAILAVLHRNSEHPVFDRVIRLNAEDA